MKLRWFGHLTLTASLALLLGACTATPIPLPFNDAGAGNDAGSVDIYVWPDLQPSLKLDSGPADSVAIADALPPTDAEAGITEGGITEGGITEGGITEGGPPLDLSKTDLTMTD